MFQDNNGKIEWSDKDFLRLLESLDKGYNPSPTESEFIKNQIHLDLNIPKATIIPRSIGALINLKTLKIHAPKISVLPDSIGNLSSLQELDLGSSGIASLPKSIGSLCNLQTLNLSGTKITSLPNNIKRLSNLLSLDLSSTTMSCLSKAVCNIPRLQTMNLRGSKINKLPKYIKCLANLQSLDLAGTTITNLPDAIGQLDNLQTLSLRGTQVNYLPESIGNLRHLCSLDLGVTGIRRLPESICQIDELQVLDLSGTLISALPESIGQLSSLNKLVLSDTPITSLPETLNNLESIQRILIAGTKISKLPESIALGKLPIRDAVYGEKTGIYAARTELPSFYFEGKEVLAQYFSEGKKQGFQEAKIIFLGDGNAGKTFTINRFLKGGMPEPSENTYSNGQTHGVKPYSYPHKKDGKDFIIHLWDFGGQELLHAMHRCFLTENTVYVLMVSTRGSEHMRRLRYWLYNIRPFSSSATVLVIVNAFDGEGTADIDEIGLKNEFKNDLEIQFVTLSVKDSSLEQFHSLVMEPLLQEAEKAENATGLHPVAYMRIKNQIKKELNIDCNDKGQERYWINGSDYVEICNKKGITDAKEQAALLRYFTNLGVCFSTIDPKAEYVSDNCRLFRPIWLTNALYAIIEECKPLRGWLDMEKIQNCLRKEPGSGRTEKYTRVEPTLRYSSEDCTHVLEIAERHSLAYRDQDDADAIFFPAMCTYSDKKTEDLDAPEHPAYSVIYELEFPYLSETIVQHLMLDCLRMGYRRPLCWRGGFRFEHDSCSGIVDTTEDDRILCIKLWSLGQSPVYEQLVWFRKHLIPIIDLHYFPKEYISAPGDRYSLSRLINAKLRGIERVPKENDPDSEYTVSELLGTFTPLQKLTADSFPLYSITEIYNNNGSGLQVINNGSVGIVSVQIGEADRDTDLSWRRFAANYPNTRVEFEHLCKDLFRQEYFDEDTIFSAIPNNPGLEFHPKKATKGSFVGKRIGFQAKYFDGSVGYTDIKDSIEKAIEYYHKDRPTDDQLKVFILFCNQMISESDESKKIKGNQTFETAKNMLEKADIELSICAGQDLLDRILKYPSLVERYFYV